jgi:micrococcal nuclease
MIVVRVVDGDTVTLAAPSGGGTVKARLLGIDTPETVDPRRGVGCYGPEASAWAKRTLLGKHVMMRTDPTQHARDTYGRALVYLTLPDGQDYSIRAAREGYAKYYLHNTPVQEAAQIQTAEQEARAAGRGLWGPPCYSNTDAAPVVQHQVPTPVAKPAPTTSSGGGAYYKNCAAARAAGVAPLHRGDPGYRSALDRDGDGIACE